MGQLYNESYKTAADSICWVRYLHEADLKVYYSNKYIVKMRMGAFYRCGKKQTEMAEDLRMYKSQWHKTPSLRH